MTITARPQQGIWFAASQPPASGEPGPHTPSPAHSAAGSGPGEGMREGRGEGMGAALRPLLIDVAAPLALYYLLNAGFGVSVWFSLAISGVIPVIRTVASLAQDHSINMLAALMLVVDVAGIVVSFLAGDPRLMIAKDAVISSAIGFAILISVAINRPIMTASLKPFMTRGDARRTAAWDHLAAHSARFHRLELLFSAIWGLALLADSAARLIGAFALPVTTMVWAGTVMILATVLAASLISSVASHPLDKMITAEVEATPATR